MSIPNVQSVGTGHMCGVRDRELCKRFAGISEWRGVLGLSVDWLTGKRKLASASANARHWCVHQVSPCGFNEPPRTRTSDNNWLVGEMRNGIGKGTHTNSLSRGMWSIWNIFNLTGTWIGNWRSLRNAFGRVMSQFHTWQRRRKKE